MAKRRQTTGLPKKQRSSSPDTIENPTFIDGLLGNPRTRAEREEALNRLIIRSIIAISAVFVIVFAILIINDQLIVPNQTVAIVNGENITVREFRERVRFERALVSQQMNSRIAAAQQQATQFGVDVNQLLQNDQQFLGLQREFSVPDLLGQRVINEMVNDKLIEQEAQSRNITVDANLIEGEINDFFGFDPTQVALVGTPATATPTATITATPLVSPTPAPTAFPTATAVPVEETPEATPEAESTADAESTAEATEDALAQAPTLAPSPTPSQDDLREQFEENVELFSENIRDVGEVGQAAVDAFFERQARRTALQNTISGTEDMALYANVRHILVDTDDEAQNIIEALEAGESFAALAQALSTDTGSGSNGGELGWQAVAQYVPEFADAIREAPIGEVVGPVESEFGFHVIQVRAREEREVEGALAESVRDADFERWLENFREENEPNIEIFDTWPNFVN